MANTDATTKKTSKSLEIKEKIPLVRRENTAEDVATTPLDIIDDYVFYKDEDGLAKIDLEKVLFFEADSNYTNIYSFEERVELIEVIEAKEENVKTPVPGKFKMDKIKVVEKHVLRMTLADVIRKLPPKKFIRVNRTYALSAKYITKLGKNYALFEDDASIIYAPSKDHYKQLLSQIILLTPRK